MQKFLFLLAFSFISLIANECENKLSALNNELDYAKKYENDFKIKGLQDKIALVKANCAKDASFYDKLKEQKESKRLELERLEKELSALESAKKSMSKAEFKAKKEELKAKKDRLKSELKSLE